MPEAKIVVFGEISMGSRLHAIAFSRFESFEPSLPVPSNSYPSALFPNRFLLGCSSSGDKPSATRPWALGNGSLSGPGGREGGEQAIYRVPVSLRPKRSLKHPVNSVLAGMLTDDHCFVRTSAVA
jgi:hypothetical protein